MDKVLQLNKYQFKQLNLKLREDLNKTKGLSGIQLNTDWPTASELENPNIAPDFFKQQELMSQLSKWLGKEIVPNRGGGGSGSGDASGGSEEVKKAATPKPAAVVSINN